MKVKLDVTYVRRVDGADVTHAPGDEIEVDEKEGKRLIGGKFAKEVQEKKPAKGDK